MKTSRSLAATAVGALLISLAPGLTTSSATAADPRPELTADTAVKVAGDKGPALSLGKAEGRELYIVTLDAPAVPTRELADASDGITATTERGYRNALRADQAELTSSIARVTGDSSRVRTRWTEAINGMAVELTRDEALEVSRLDGVAGVQVDFTRQLNTDVGPEWIGAPGIWEGTETPTGVDGSKGEGVVIGILDTGINPANPSFAATVPVEEGGDGYVVENPLDDGNGSTVDYLGACDPGNTDQFIEDWGCNDKLIGYYDFDVTNNNDGDYDDDGHGSHTASTAAGNQVEATVYSAEGTPQEFSWTGGIKGVAPHANIVSYDVCDGTGCQGSSILNALESIIDDGVVDAMNYSIGSPDAGDPWLELDSLAFLNVRAAGIHVANSAGNEGPGAATTGFPGLAPWMNSTAATQHDRQWQAEVRDLANTAGPASPGVLEGLAFAAPTSGAKPIVYAGSISAAAATCGVAPLTGVDLTGKIVVCDRGGEEDGEPIGRVAKGENVLARGAVGMILANDEDSGDSLVADAHVLPTVHITYDDGVVLKAWLAASTNPTGSLSGGLRHVGDDVADIMASFSSRGPNRAASTISPSAAAPGVDILAAAGTDNEVEWHFISGTSMASPHVAGSLGLLAAVQPDWTPAEAQSALMTTSVTEITDNDGSPADWFDMGAGRVDLNQASKAGFVLDETEDAYLAADPAAGGDPRTLNLASMADDECLAECSWTRSLTGTATGEGEWTVSTESLSDGLTLDADATLELADGDTADLAVTATVEPGSSTEEWLFGVVTLTPPAGVEAPEAHLPVAVLPSSGVLPDEIEIPTRRDAGSWETDGLEAIEISDLQITPSGLVEGERTQLTVPLDTTNLNPFDGNGVVATEVEVPEGATRLIAKLEDPTAPDFDLYVGTGAVSADNVQCQSASGGSNESCEVANPEPGTWWVLVQNWEASNPTDPDTTTLLTAVPAGPEGNLEAEGPTGPVPAEQPFTIRTFFDEPEMDEGETWYGSLTLGSAPGSPSDIGVIPVTVHRLADDVTLTASSATAARGDTITYTVDIAPNVAQDDLTYEIEATIPAGATYVEGSATGGASFVGGKVSWSGTLESPVGAEGQYTFTTSATDADCVNPFTEEQDYLDLEGFGFGTDDGVTGNAVAFTAGAATSTYGLYDDSYAGLTFTDDGFLVFDPAANYQGSVPGTTQAIPDTTKPNNLAAMLWQDMQLVYNEAQNAGVTLATAGDLRIVEFDNLRLASDPTGAQGTVDMEVFAIDGTNEYVFAYDNVTVPRGSVTIGAENAQGSRATALVNKGDASSVITDGTLVCMTYGPAPVDGASFSYQVKVDAGTAIGTDLENEAVSAVDQAGSTLAVAEESVEVVEATSSTALSLDPASIKTGATTTATATVTSGSATKPTGQVQFLVGGQVRGSGTLDASGKATATLSGFTTAGTFPVTARYVGDGTVSASTSAPVNLVVSVTEPPAKVKPKVEIKAKDKVQVGSRPKVKVVVTAKGVTPTGEVTVKTKLGKRSKTYKVQLNAQGKAKLTLKKVKQTGKLKVKVAYAGDAAAEPGKAKTVIKVVPKKK